ncbi:MAG: MarR family transcriptional regulator [Burkholderiales bacterium]|nr:MarR family transcriptional regulator [Burkholderiales bacterium]
MIELPPAIRTRPDLLLRHAHQVSSALFNEHFAEFGLTAPQHSILMVLESQPGLSQAAIGRALGYDRATTGELIRRLAARGLVERPGSGAGRNGLLVSLTEDGAGLLRQSAAAVQRTMRQWLSPLQPDERRTLVDLLARLASRERSPLDAVDRSAGAPDPAECGDAAAMRAQAIQAPERSGSEPASMRLERRITFRFSRLAALSTKPVAKLFLRRFGLTLPSWRALITIGSLQPTSPTEVAKRMSIEAYKVTRAVDNLVAKQLVQRNSDVADGRRSVLVLTRRGAKVYTEIDAIRWKIESELLSVLSEQERKNFHAYMDKVDAHGRRILPDEQYWKALFRS